MAGAVRVVEVTHGASGWHVHLHVLLLLDSGRDAVAQLVALLTAQQPVMAAWQRIVGRAGFQAVAQAQDLRPVDLADGQCAVGGYFVKSGWDIAAEIACGSLKTARTGNMTPMALLRHFTSTGDAETLELWHEWEAVTCGRRQMTWSRGIRSRLQLLASEADAALAEIADDGAEQTDEDIAGSQDRGDKPFLILGVQTWRHVRHTDLLWRLLEIAEQQSTRWAPETLISRLASHRRTR